MYVKDERFSAKLNKKRTPQYKSLKESFFVNFTR
jgi:hypothetical protein